MKNDNDLFYLCGLIEHIGRTRKLRRRDVVRGLGEENLRRIYKYADVLHSDSIDRVAEEYSALARLEKGDFDNVASCRYEVPDRWAIAGVFSRLVEDVSPENGEIVSAVADVYDSWISDAVSNYNTDFYYQPRSYLAACYEAGEVLE